MKAIDAHAHIYEHLSGFGPSGEARAIGEGKVEWATGKVETFLRAEHGDKEFTAEKLIELMDEASIEKAVILQGSNYGFQNSYIASAVKNHPDRLVGVGSFDPYCKWADDILENLTERLGFKALKFELSELFGLTGYHPDLKIDGPIFDRYFSAAEEMGLTVTLDTGDWGTASYQIEGIIRVIKRHPGLRLVVAHTLFPFADGNNPKRLEYIKRLAGENTYFDIANLHSPRDNTRYEYIKAAMDIVGANHMMWGTDCPGVFLRHSYKDLIGFVCDCGLFNAAELSCLMHDTAKEVYNIK